MLGRFIDNLRLDFSNAPDGFLWFPHGQEQNRTRYYSKMEAGFRLSRNSALGYGPFINDLGESYMNSYQLISMHLILGKRANAQNDRNQF